MARKLLFRIAAILIGITATLLVVEAVLQTASQVARSADRNRGRVPSEGELRIACIGESTTYGLWPGQLEEILNERSAEREIRVINRGAVGIRTDGVAGQIEEWLDEDRPHLVITMLGINDEGNVLVYPRDDSRSLVADRLKTARFLRLLWRSAFDIGVPEANENDPPRADGHLDDEVRMELDRLEGRRPEAMAKFRITEMIEIHRDLLAVDPGTPVYHLAFLKGMVVHHDLVERVDETLVGEFAVAPSELDDEERTRLIGLWAERTGDRFAALRLAASIAQWGLDPYREQLLLENATKDPDLAGLAWLRLADLASRRQQPDAIRMNLLRADDALPDDYQWSLLIGHLAFQFEVYDVAAASFHRALMLRPDLPTSHELVLLGRLANACKQAGDAAGAADYRRQRDELELGRFREFTRYHYQRVVDSVRAREIPVIAMQYPLLSVKSLRKLLDYRDDVTYLENRTNFETALLGSKYRAIFEDSFAGSFGHLSPRGNMLVAENVADALAGRLPEPTLTGTPAPGLNAESP